MTTISWNSNLKRTHLKLLYIKKSKKSTNEPDTSQAFDDDDDLDVDYQEVDKAEKQYYDFEKFLKAEQELAMARMKFAEKRMR